MEFERKRYHAHLDMAPLIDVVLNLLLFFMLTSHLVQEPAIQITLPSSRTAEAVQQTIKMVSVTKVGEIFLQDKRVDLKNLRAELLGSLSDPAKDFVRIKADRDVPVGLLVKIIDEVRLGGIIHFSILTTKDEKP
jgi:biopolymer transport protein ExbD